MSTSQPYVSLTEGFGKTVGNIGQGFGAFSNNRFLDSTKDFLNSNSIIAKLAFLFLVIILFVIIIRVSTSLMSWYFKPADDPKLVKGMINASKQGAEGRVIHQDPNVSGSITLLRSKNEDQGLEFTYSTWLNIDDVQLDGKYKHIFHKGNADLTMEGENKGLSLPNNAPGLYLDKDTNSLVVVMNTFNNITEQVKVGNIPYNKWFNVIIRVEGRNMDVYINGTITLRHQFTSVPKQNYGNVYVCMNKGFLGYLSDLWYHNRALNTYDIMKIVEGGPDLTSVDATLTETAPPYFSLRWYLDH